ncbi:MAG: YggU family protein [Acidobacteria bacterium 13_1_40CM_3_55_6]|nr:MAG: YggU family protein [Acidobacteria bacterium 13_1_40CM_3_55_6]
MIQCSEDNRGLTFAVRVVPRASRSELVGEQRGALRVRIAAPPVEGAANKELIKLLSKSFKLPKNAVQIISGLTSRNKIVRIKGADATRLQELICLK